jgi:hypothetical protein
MDIVLTGTSVVPGTAAILIPPKAVPEVLGSPGPLRRTAKPSQNGESHSN